MIEQPVGQREEVVLEYEYQQQEMTDALRAVLRKRGGSGFLYHPVFLVCAGLFGAALLVLGICVDDGAWFAFGVMFLVWPVLMSRVPHMSGRQTLRANQHHGPMRVTIANEGVRVVSAHIDTRMGWANYGSYAETEHCFLLRSPDRAGVCALVLVKRGARSQEDVDRLRALLDRRLPRV
ncbi:hypothetical protein NGF19_01925 [Streptomyces sp. RY43-2]|uniref:YcxB-like protein domain-containing protein n=1 Tax=Streptomyces macrolidinus TaxID=2952607 RepID=A0ABT0Z9P6_9ACTN|nr:hypothetical protein [Streptomyces macrolidinus]MCN9239551.1 hypothetical protein [Streptomyces macrolidinus]